MDFGLREAQLELKRSARDFLSKECPTATVRNAMADNAGVSVQLEAALAGMGWHAILVPEEFGGAGLTMLDMAVVL
jgi:alkylation response protein AidB-like acyl-CoA dehydrogenase